MDPSPHVNDINENPFASFVESVISEKNLRKLLRI